MLIFVSAYVLRQLEDANVGGVVPWLVRWGIFLPSSRICSGEKLGGIASVSRVLHTAMQARVILRKNLT